MFLLILLSAWNISGHFGCVYRGLLKYNDRKQEDDVAVKTLKSPSGTTFCAALSQSCAQSCNDFMLPNRWHWQQGSWELHRRSTAHERLHSRERPPSSRRLHRQRKGPSAGCTSVHAPRRPPHVFASWWARMYSSSFLPFINFRFVLSAKNYPARLSTCRHQEFGICLVLDWTSLKAWLIWLRASSFIEIWLLVTACKLPAT